MFARLVELMDPADVDGLLTHRNLSGQTPPVKAIYFGKERCAEAMIQHVLRYREQAILTLLFENELTSQDVFWATIPYVECVYAAFDPAGVATFG